MSGRTVQLLLHRAPGAQILLLVQQGGVDCARSAVGKRRNVCRAFTLLCKDLFGGDLVAAVHLRGQIVLGVAPCAATIVQLLLLSNCTAVAVLRVQTAGVLLRLC